MLVCFIFNNIHKELLNGDSKYAVIRAVYDSLNSPEEFEKELDCVLLRNVNVVVIEPEDLGELTWKWIKTGNCLHKTAVLSGLGALFMAASANRFFFDSNASLVLTTAVDTGLPKLDFLLSYCLSPRLMQVLSCLTLGTMSATSAGLYALLWQCDPCAKYQVASTLKNLPNSFVRHVSIANDNRDSTKLEKSLKSKHTSPMILPNRTVNCDSILRPVILVRRDDSTRKLVHNYIAAAATIVACAAVLKLSKL